jgi:hypothetical protein
MRNVAPYIAVWISLLFVGVAVVGLLMFLRPHLRRFSLVLLFGIPVFGTIGAIVFAFLLSPVSLVLGLLLGSISGSLFALWLATVQTK